jgi:hypothetical protein
MAFSDEVGLPVLRFNIRRQDSKLDSTAIRRLVEEATKEAEAAASADNAESAKVQMPGAFGGVGELAFAVHLLLPYLQPLLPYLQEAGKELAGGVMTGAGEYFFQRYLAPRLRKRNLLPSKVEVKTETKPAQESPQTPPAKSTADPQPKKPPKLAKKKTKSRK